MNILYIHGLDSKLKQAKRNILEKYGKVYAPDIDYYNDPDAIQSTLKLYPGVEINTVIGSSMGGFAGFYISTILQRPALLFNPALKHRSVEQIVPQIPIDFHNFKQFVIGAQDEVVKPADTLEFIAKSYNRFTEFHLHIRPELSHRIPEPVFEEEVETFFGRLSR